MQKNRRRIASAILSLFTALTLVAALPMNTQAATNVVWNDDGKTVKSFTIDPFDYVDYSGILGTTEFDAAGLESIAKSEMPKWNELAVQIFKSGSETNSSYSGVTSNISADAGWPNWEESFMARSDSMSGTDYCKINLVNWLNKQTSKRYGEKTDANVYASGLVYATSLDAARQEMADEIAVGCGGYVEAIDVLNHDAGSEEDKGSVLPGMYNKNTTKGYYSVVTSIQEPSYDRYYYNSYGVMMYDFELTPVADKDIPFKDASLNKTESADNRVEYSTYSENTSTSDSTVDASIATNIEQTITNSITNTESLGITTTIGSDTTISASLQVVDVSETIHVDVSTSKTLETAREHSEELKTAVDQSVTVSTELPAHTGLEIFQTEGPINVVYDYSCPVVIRYKVAIFSISGYVYAVTKDTYGFPDDATYCDFSTFFGTGSTDGGYGAPDNLYYRGIEGKEKSFGNANGRYNDRTKMNRLDWSQISISDTVEDMATTLPLMSQGASITVSNDGKTSRIGQIAPLYQLTQIRQTEGEPLYEMVTGDTLNLQGLGVNGYDADKVLFHGFDPEKGHWVLSKVDGTELTTSEVAEIEENAATGRAILTANEPGEVYLKWILSDDAKYYSTKDEKTVTKTLNPPSYPMVQIKVKEAPVDLTDYRVEASGEAEITVGEELNLTNAFSPAVYDNTGVLITKVVKFEAEDQSATTPVTIDEDGVFTSTQEGDYKVRAYYEKGGSKVVSGWLTVTVKAAPVVTYMTATDPDAVKITGTNPSAGFALASYVQFFDQYDNAWEGETPALTFALPAGTEGAEIDENGMLTVTKGGTYAVTASAEGLEDITIDVTVLALDELTIADESNVLADFKFNKGDNKVDLSGLTYTGKDQNGDEWDMADETIVWHVMKEGEGSDTEETLDGNVFTAPSDGTYNVYATSGAAGDVKSNELTLTVLPEPVLSALVISGPITDDGLGVGDGYAIDVTKDITVEAKDQYDEKFELTDEELVWTADGRYAKLSGDTLTGKAEGTGTLTLSIAVPGAAEPVTSNTLEFEVFVKPYVSEFWADDAGTILEGEVFDLKDVAITAHDQHNNPYVLSDEEKASIVWEITNLTNGVKAEDVEFDEAAGTIVVHEGVLPYGDRTTITVTGTFTNPNGKAPTGNFRITVEQKPILHALTLAKQNEDAVLATEQVKYCMDFFTVEATDQYQRAFDLTNTPLTFASDNSEAYIITDADNKEISMITAGTPDTSANISVSSVVNVAGKDKEVVSNTVPLSVPRVRRLKAVDFSVVPEYLPVNTELSMEDLGAKCFDERGEEYNEEDLAAYPAKITYTMNPEVNGKETAARLDTGKNILRTGGTRGYIILYANAVNATTSKKILDQDGNEIIKEAKVWIGPMIDKVAASQDTFHVQGGKVTVTFTGKLLEGIEAVLLDEGGNQVQTVTAAGSETEQTAEFTIPDNTSLTAPAVYTVQYTVCGDPEGADEFAPASNITITVENHTLAKTEAKDPKCEEDGNIEYWQCSKCGKYYADENAAKEISQADTVLKAIGHKWDEGAVTTEPACEKDGVKTFTCQNDKSHTRTEAVPAIGHQWDEGVVTKEATCEEAGVKTFTCKNDPTHTRTEEIPAIGHAWDTGKITKAAKAGANGIITYTCTNDASHKKTEPLPVMLMQMKAYKKNALILKWTAEPLADGYEIYTAPCRGDKDTSPFKLKKTIRKNTTTKWVWKKLKTGDPYKAYVKAYKKINGKKKYIAISYQGHAIAGNNSAKSTNAKSLKLKQKSVTLQTGKKFRIKGSKIIGFTKGKKILKHTPVYRFAVTDTAVATVSKKGVIKGVGAGSCKVYVIVPNGVRAAIQVTVQ